MKNSIIRLFVILHSFFLYRCNEQSNLPPVTKLYVINTSGNDVSSRRFDACRLKYTFLNPTSDIAASIEQKSLEIPFQLWEEAHGYLTFEKAEITEFADIRIIFSDTISFGHIKTTEGLIPQEIPALSTIRYFDERVDIYLRKSFEWTVPVLQKVLLSEIGSALGLAYDNDISLISPTDNSAALSLTESEINNIKAVYNVKCDEWKRVTDLELLKTASQQDISTFSIGGIGYLTIRNYGQSYLLTYNPSSEEWNHYPSPTSNYPSSQTGAFSIGDSGYIALKEDFYSSKLLLWKVSPNSPKGEYTWTEQAPLPEPVANFFIAFSIKDKAYVIPNNTLTKSLTPWEYDPKANKWQKMESFIDDKSNIGSLLVGRNGGFIIDNKAYIDLEYRLYGLEYDPVSSPHWSRYSRPNLGDGNSFISFSVRGAGYSISRLENSPTGRQLFRFEPKTGWTLPGLLKPFPGTGFIVFQMVIHNRVYLGTNTGEFWMYTP